ncbi:MAG: hypothetical protein LUH00_01675 [Lachnospiraceae bacterium]|nr:hypothetical protein [Lachnospiraceae bacterium]
MTASVTNINKSIQAISVYLVLRVSEEKKCTQEEALRLLLKTMTFDLLQDKGSGLYAESPEYVWDMLQKEERGNLKEWMEN